MTEYASLVLRVDSKSAVDAKQDLSALSAEGGKTEDAFLNVEKAAAVAATAIAAAAAAAVGMVAASASAADAAGEMAQSAGLTTEEFTRLQYAMQFDGAPENLGQSMKFLNNAMVDAANGSGKSADAFAALGVSATNADGSLRNSHDIMLQIADRFAGMADGAQKASLATDIFGRAGADMIPFLNNGAAGIAQLEAEADKLGVTISDNTAQAAGHLTDNVSKLKSAGAGFSNQVMSAMLPALNGLGDELVASANNSGALEMAGKALVVVLKSVLTAAVVVGAAIKTIGDIIGATAAAAVAVASGDFKGAWEILKAGANDTVDNISAAMTRVDMIWNASAQTVENAEARKVNAMHATAAAAADAAVKAATPKDGMDASAVDSVIADDRRQKAEEEANKKRLEQLTNEFGSEVEIENIHYQQRLDNYRWYAEQKGIAVDESNAVIEQMNADHNAKIAAIDQAAAWAKTNSVINSLSEIETAITGRNKTMFKIQKVAAIAQGLLSIQTGVANAMSLPFPANLAAAAAVATQGAGIMANLKSITDSGGGSIKGPSKGGGLSLGSSSGEGVGNNAPARQPVTDIRLVGIRPEDMFSGAMLKNIIEGVGETLSDNGGRMGKVTLVMNA